MNTLILIGNIICMIGALFLTYSYYQIGVKINLKKGFYISSIGSSILIVGCIILSSYPFVALNVLWLIISMIGLKEVDLKTNSKYLISFAKKSSTLIITGLLINGLINVYLGDEDQAAWMTTGIYLFTYLLFSAKIMKREHYLAWCIPAFLLSIPHLLEVSNFAVILNEFVGASISIYSLILLTKYFNKYDLNGNADI